MVLTDSAEWGLLSILCYVHSLKIVVQANTGPPRPHFIAKVGPGEGGGGGILTVESSPVVLMVIPLDPYQ